MQKDLALLPTRPTPITTGHYGQSFPSTGSYAGQNATELAVIQYYLKDRLNTGDVTVEVYSADGKLMASLPGTKRKGINYVRWDMRAAPPKAARGVLVQGEFGVYAGFIGQTNLPGEYKVKIKAGNFSDEGSLTLIADPLQPELDYAKKRSQSDELFSMVQDLGLLEAQVRNLKDSLDQRNTLAKDKKAKAAITQLSGQLDSFRKTLTETIESNGITGEQQLRARIGKLYVLTEFTDEMPTKSIMDGAEPLRGELADAQKKADQYFQKELAAVNALLKKEKLAPLRVIDRAEWLRQTEKTPPPPPGKPWMWGERH
ncbi:MAG TPA: hypothetical protein PK858_12365 [Saprospiraceae bacterium]|nr:hypothetical protein [Saprospiraceae bacterium]